VPLNSTDGFSVSGVSVTTLYWLFAPVGADPSLLQPMQMTIQATSKKYFMVVV